MAETVGPIEQVHPVVVLAGERLRGGVGLELAGRQECLLGMLFALRHIVHRHRRVGVPGVALQYVRGQAEFGEPSKAGVPESVGLAEAGPRVLSVLDINKLAELLQRSSVYAFVDGLFAVRVAQAAGKQEARCPKPGVSGTHCLLLLLDDRDNLGIDEDVVWRPIDLGLRVAESGDLLASCGLDGASGRRQEAVKLAHAYLTYPPASQYPQQQHSHRLRITAAGQLTLGVTDAAITVSLASALSAGRQATIWDSASSST